MDTQPSARCLDDPSKGLASSSHEQPTHPQNRVTARTVRPGGNLRIVAEILVTVTARLLAERDVSGSVKGEDDAAS